MSWTNVWILQVIPSFGTSTSSQLQTTTNSNNNNPSSSKSSQRVRASSPLDLSSSQVNIKRPKVESPCLSRKAQTPSPTIVQQIKRVQSHTPNNESLASATTQVQRRCHVLSDEISSWTVEQVCNFVGSIDICAEYTEVSVILLAHEFSYYFYHWEQIMVNFVCWHFTDSLHTIKKHISNTKHFRSWANCSLSCHLLFSFSFLCVWYTYAVSKVKTVDYWYFQILIAIKVHITTKI